VTDQQALAAYGEAERPHLAGAPTSIAIGRDLLTLRADRDAALARVAVLADKLRALHSAALAFAEQPHTARDTANWMKAMREASGALNG
jgi:hypothetical protein